MSDLVKLLREAAEMPKSMVMTDTAMREAADEIERLAAELAEARDKQDRWYSTEARLHGLLIEVCGSKAYGEAVGRLCDPTLAEHNPIIAERDALAADNARLAAELAEAKRELERMDGMHRAFDAKYIAWLGERDALQAQVAGLKDAIHEALECALPPHAERALSAALAGPTRTADQPSIVRNECAK